MRVHQLLNSVSSRYRSLESREAVRNVMAKMAANGYGTYDRQKTFNKNPNLSLEKLSKYGITASEYYQCMYAAGT